MITILVALAVIALLIFIFSKSGANNKRISMMQLGDKIELHPKYNQYREKGKKTWKKF